MYGYPWISVTQMTYSNMQLIQLEALEKSANLIKHIRNYVGFACNLEELGNLFSFYADFLAYSSQYS